MLCFLALLLLGGAPTHGISIDSLGLKADDVTRWYSFTNKGAGFYFGEANGGNLASYQGWTVFDDPVLKDYDILIDGKKLDRRNAETVIYPNELVRKYPEGVVEKFSMLDNLNVLVINLHSPKQVSTEFEPLFNGIDPRDFLVRSTKPIVIENRSVPQDSYGHWIALSGTGSVKKMSESGPFRSPILVRGKGKDVSFLISCGRTELEAKRVLSKVSEDYADLILGRKERMQKLLDQSSFEANDIRLNKAIAWARLSLDALVTDQGMKGIWAGLPWFNDYWGRDSFISLPALLYMGEFGTARQILLDFASKQNMDSTSEDFGRIPNRITPREVIYNTADGTPLFVYSAFLYYSMTEDRAFLFQIYPTIRRAFEGSIGYHMGKDLFLSNGDQETWMDAVGPNGPYTPRGSKAVDVQADWMKQVLATRFLSRYAGDTQMFDVTTELAKRLAINFNRDFVDSTSSILYDHLNADSTRDSTFRPNQIFSLWMLSSRDEHARILKNIVENLVYPWGVASLCQDDPDFHPYHHNEPLYAPDEAYHNGTVWLWLTGPLVSDLVAESEPDFAFRCTSYLTDEILEGKTAGMLPELFDAFPREGKEKPDESGAFSQAWSLAEYIKNFYEDYLGVQINVPEGSIVLSPHLPSAIRRVSFRLNSGNGGSYDISYRLDSLKTYVDIMPLDSVKGIVFKVFQSQDLHKQIRTAFYFQGKSEVRLTLSADTVTAEKDGRAFVINNLKSVVYHDSTLDDLHFQKPANDTSWTFLKRDKFMILSTKEVKSSDKYAGLFAAADDSSGDDRGPDAKYTYPLNQNFKKGILDITRAVVAYDSTSVFFHLYFKNLVNPMWHPEYGYQLTFCAIAIGNGSGGERAVGRNSHFVLPAERGFERIIFVGGGVELCDSAGKKIAAYVPAPGDTSNPLGDTIDKEISFAIPVSLLGKPDRNWKITILVGAQDDHGGVGVGEFRNIAATASEWEGGGKQNPSSPNVYDELIVR